MDPKGNYVDSLGKVNDMASIPSDRAGSERGQSRVDEKHVARSRIALIAAGAANSPFGSARSLITNTWRSLMSEPPVSNCVLGKCD